MADKTRNASAAAILRMGFLALLLFLAACAGAASNLSPTVTLETTPTSQSLPDLVVLSATLESQSVISCSDPESHLGISVLVGNQGLVEAGSFSVDVNGDHQMVDAGLAPGAEIRLGFPEFSEKVVVTVDWNSQVAEINEQNNRFEVHLQSPTLPAECLPTPTPVISLQNPVAQLNGHTGKVLSIAFSPDGRLLASGSVDNTLRLWRVEDWSLLRTMPGHAFPVLELSFSPSGAILATGSTDGLLRIWQVSNGSLYKTLSGHAGWITALAYSPNSRYLASAADDFTIRLWRLSDYRQALVIDEGMSGINDLAYSSDGEQLAWAEENGTVRVWSISRTAWDKLLTGPNQPARTVNFLTNNNWLAAGYDDGHIRIWSLDDGNLLLDVAAHIGAINAVATSLDGRWLVSASRDEPLKLWRIENTAASSETSSQDPLVQLNLNSILSGSNVLINDLAFSMDNRWIASAANDNTILIWQVPEP